jgi:predicted phage tail protein
MVKITLHGKLGEDIGKEWDLEVSSVNEAFRAIEANTRKLRKWIINNKNYEYHVLLNKKILDIPNNPLKVPESEIFCVYKKNQLKTIDLIPNIVGAGWGDWYGWAEVVGGAGAIAAGVTAGQSWNPIPTPMAPAVIIAGIALIADGVSRLVSKPPPKLMFAAQQATTSNQGSIGDGQGVLGGPQSYLFNGPVNLVGEGGPIPVGYGTLMVGSIAANVYYENTYVTNKRSVIWNESDVRFLQNNNYGFQNYFNEQLHLISQSSSYLV